MVAFRGNLPFHGVPLVPGLLSLGDLLFAVVVAYFITRLVGRLFGRGEDASRVPLDLAQLPEAAEAIVARCYTLFPIESVMFRGETFTRGMLVKVTTTERGTYEGRFLGLNDDNVICVLTSRKISANPLDDVEEIIKIETVE